MKHHAKSAKVEHVKRDEMWITLEDPRFTELVLKSIGDKEKKNIINAVIDKPHVIPEILEISMIPQTSGYRKINTLIDDGILIPQGYVTTHDGKRVTKYKAIFDNISILIEKNKVVVKVRLTQNPVN
jgi:predicted transcriptional regulator